MSTPLTDAINALTRYANETTGASDTTLSEAVNTLVEGFGKGGGALWKSVTLAEDHITPGVGNPLYWREYLGISESDILDGYIFFVEVLNNSGFPAQFYMLHGFYYAYSGAVQCMFIRNNLNSGMGFYKNNYNLFATAGTVMNVYRFKADDNEVKRVSVEDITTGFEDFGGDITINSTYIRDYAFARGIDTNNGEKMNEVSSITSLYAPNCLSVGEYAFRLNSNLRSINLPNCNEIKQSAFAGYSMYYNMGIVELIIPKVKNIGNNAFYYNYNAFEKLVLPGSLQTIGNYSFANNLNLKTIYFMGSNVTSIGSTCFGGSRNITDIYVPWSEGAVANAPWGASNATIHYNTVYDSNGEPII